MLEKRKWEYGNSILRFIFLIFAPGRKLTFQHPTNEIQKIKHFHNLQKSIQKPQNQEGEAVGGERKIWHMGQREGDPNSFLVSKPLTSSQTPQKPITSSPPSSTGLPWLPLCKQQEEREKLLWGISTISNRTDRGKRHQRSWWAPAEAAFFQANHCNSANPQKGVGLKQNQTKTRHLLSQCHTGHREAQTGFPPPQERQMSSQYTGAHPKPCRFPPKHRHSLCGPAHSRGTLGDLTVMWSPDENKAVPQNEDDLPADSQKKKCQEMRTQLSAALEITWIKIRS